ncbi:hypothetical protein GCM10023115_48260 [Pontixanthobacter gangjinensis]
MRISLKMEICSFSNREIINGKITKIREAFSSPVLEPKGITNNRTIKIREIILSPVEIPFTLYKVNPIQVNTKAVIKRE